MSKMFYNCSYLALLDISNFVINNGTDYTDIFGDLPNLKYISLINININGETNETFSSFNERKELLVCQNNPYISLT